MATRLEINPQAKPAKPAIKYYKQGQVFDRNGVRFKLIRTAVKACMLIRENSDTVWDWSVLPYLYEDAYNFGVSQEEFHKRYPAGVYNPI